MTKEKQFRAYVGNDKELRPLHSYKDPDKLIWGLPTVFTISKARELLKDTPSILKRLEGLKPGTKLRLGKVSLNSYHFIMVDEKYDQEYIDGLKNELEQVNAKIQEQVGHLLKRQKELRELIKNAAEP